MGLHDMSPCHAQNSAARRRRRYAKLFGDANQCRSRVSHAPHLPNLFVGQLSQVLSHSAVKAFGIFSRSVAIPSCQSFGIGSGVMNIALGITALAMSIGNIIRVGSEPQMIRINASRIVAAMQNAQPIANFATVDNPRRTIGPHFFSEHERLAISDTSRPASPIPTSICLGDVFEKIANRWMIDKMRSHLKPSMFRVPRPGSLQAIAGSLSDYERTV